jgi:hypothetical protein
MHNDALIALAEQLAELTARVEALESKQRNTSARMQKPSIAEIHTYAVDLGIPSANTFAATFHAHYESNGWKVGRNAMKDWRAAVRTWRNTHQRQPAKPAAQSNSAEEIQRRLENGWMDR